MGQSRKPKQTPTLKWLIFLVLAPWIHLLVGALVIAVASSSPEPASLIRGIILSLYAVSLLATTVYTLHSPRPPRVNPKVHAATHGAFYFVVLVAVVLVVLWQLGQVSNTGTFLGMQLFLVAIAIPFSWKARA